MLWLVMGLQMLHSLQTNDVYFEKALWSQVLACPNSSARRAWGSDWKVGHKARNVVVVVFSLFFCGGGNGHWSIWMNHLCLPSNWLLTQWVCFCCVTTFTFLFPSCFITLPFCMSSVPKFFQRYAFQHKKECNRWGLKYSRSPVIKNIPSWIRASGSNYRKAKN